MTRLTAAAVTLTCLLVPRAALSQSALAGDWEITLNTPQGAQTLSASLTVEGDKLTGQLTSPLGIMPVTGSVTAGAFTMGTKLSIQGADIEVGISGKLENAALNGTMKLGDFGEFPFTGKRASKAASAPASTGGGATATGGDAAGKWNITLNIGGNEFPFAATLTREGEKVAGVLTTVAGEMAVTGTMTGKALKLEFVAQTPQGPIPIVITGDLGPEGFAGKASVAGLGEADWKGKRVN